MHFVFKIILRFYNLVSPLFCPDSRTNDSLGRYTCADPNKKSLEGGMATDISVLGCGAPRHIFVIFMK